MSVIDIETAVFANAGEVDIEMLIGTAAATWSGIECGVADAVALDLGVVEGTWIGGDIEKVILLGNDC